MKEVCISLETLHSIGKTSLTYGGDIEAYDDEDSSYYDLYKDGDLILCDGESALLTIIEGDQIHFETIDKKQFVLSQEEYDTAVFAEIEINR